MAYQDFLRAFAEAQGVGTVESLLSDHATRYSFQINSRQRAISAIALLEEKLGVDWNGLRVLDVGCAYGAFSIELAKRGAHVVGMDINDKWLRLAEVNAADEVEIPFINCDASMRTARRQLAEFGQFDLVIINDVFEHIYDTSGLLANLRAIMRPGGSLYFKVPNGLATRHVLLEGHKRVFGISLLPPDYWSKFITAPFQIYYRRREYFSALFREFGFENFRALNSVTDEDIDQTRRHIQRDLRKIRQHLKAENFTGSDQFRTVRVACKYYFDEVADDLDQMAWDELFLKYRVTFWEGIIQAPAAEEHVPVVETARSPELVTAAA